MFLPKAYQKTIQAVRKNKLFFIALFFSQIIFLVLIALINVKYQLAIVENLHTVVMSLDRANYNGTLLQMGQPFLPNPQQVFQSYESIWSSLKYLLSLSLLVFLVFEGLNWSISLYMLKKQNFLKLYGKFILTTLIYLVPASALIYLTMQTAWESDIKTAVNFSISVFIIALYFMFISFSLLQNKIKNIFILTFKEKIKKADYIIFTLMVCLTIISFFAGAMYASRVWPFLTMLLTIILFILALITLRIFFIAAVLEIS